MPSGGDGERPWPAWSSRPMRMATVATIVFGGQFLARWLLGIDDTRVWALLLVFAVPGLLGALVLLAGFVQQRRPPGVGDPPALPRTAELDLPVRVGVHTTEVERLGDDLAGIGVHVGARVAAAATPGEVGHPHRPRPRRRLGPHVSTPAAPAASPASRRTVAAPRRRRAWRLSPCTAAWGPGRPGAAGR